mmetsp:Transcript_23014/g.17458  ORF Transcript_23014/g.17458 Transcript_23014/m.17458 type:complete len:155 (+) Transcript_23014:178-642(+)
MIIAALLVVLSMIKVYHILGFFYGLALFLVCFFTIAVSRMHSSEFYDGTWCDFCICYPTHHPKRESWSSIYKAFLIILSAFALLLCGIQVANIIADPNWKTFPEDCNEDKDNISCIRVANENMFNADDIVETYVVSYNLADGLNSFKSDIFFCL